jgi:hypothetical protein
LVGSDKLAGQALDLAADLLLAQGLVAEDGDKDDAGEDDDAVEQRQLEVGQQREDSGKAGDD